MKNFLLFNQSFGTVGSPNQTGETLAPSDERAMTERRPSDEQRSRIPLLYPCYTLARVWRYVACMLMVLFVGVGNVWGTEYTLINQSTGAINSTDFVVLQESTSAADRTIDGSSFAKYIALGSNTDTVGNYNLNRFVRYDVKTNSVTIDVYAHNTEGKNSRNLYISYIEEGATKATKYTYSVAAGSGVHATKTFTPSTNASISVHVSNTKLQIVQFTASESGTALKVPGEVGYTYSFNKPRNSFPSSSTQLIDNGMTVYNVSSNVNCLAGSGYVQLTGSSTAHGYIKFTTSAACQLNVKCNNTATYYVGTSSTTSDNSTSSKDANFDLSASTTYYILTGTSGLQVQSITFNAVDDDCEATANAGADKETTVGVGVAMAATAAGEGYTGAWSIKSGSPNTATSQLGMTSSNTMTFTPNTYGTYTLVWTVTDDSDGSCSASDEATVTVPAPTHAISYTNTKGAANSNPATYSEGTGIASFAKLRHVVGYDFTGWSPSSISSSATTDQTIEAQWSANAAAAGTGTLTYALAFGSGTITTSSITRNNGALYDATDVSIAHTSFADNATSKGCSGKLTTTTEKSSTNYVETTFKIADGYTFTPTEVRVQGIAVTNDKTIEVELTDNAATPNTKSVSGTLGQVASPAEGGYTVTLDFDADGTVELTGTVTVKIYAYGDNNKHWRIGTPLVITGTVAEAVVCETAPTVTTGSNSSVTATTATVSCSGGISDLGDCDITSYGFVIGTATTPAIGGSGVTQHEVGTSYTAASTSFSKDLTGLTGGTTYYVRPYATNGAGTAYGTQTSFTTSADVTAPTLSSSDPANSATDVPTSGNIVLTFSENVTIADASKFTLTGGAGTLNTASASASGAAVTIPYSGLANSTTYTLSTTAGAVQDAAGNASADLNSISFTTSAAPIYSYKDATRYVSSTYKNPEGGELGSGDNITLTTPWTICSACKTGVTSVVATAARYDNKSETKPWISAYIKLRQTDGGKVVFTIASGYVGTITIKMGGYDGANTNITMKLNDAGENITYSGTMSGGATTENGFAELTYANLAAGAYTLKPTSGSLYISEFNITTKASAPAHNLTATPAGGGICSGATATIGLDGSTSGVSYQLYNGESTVGDPVAGTGSALTLTDTITTPGTYTVKSVANATYAATTMTGSVTVSILAATSITSQPTTSVDAYTEAEFTLGSGMVVAGGGLSYQWYSYSSTDGDDEAELDGKTAATMTDTKTVAGTYYYKVKVSGSCGAPVYSDYITVTVTAANTLTYNANGGTGTMSNTAGGGSVTLRKNSYTKSGYEFIGWATSQANAAAGTVAYLDGGSFTLDADAELFAVWSPESYKFTPASSGDQPEVNATVSSSTGGTMIYTPLSGTDPYLTYDSHGLLFGSSSNCAATVTLDCAIKQGTVFTATLVGPGGAGTGRGIKLNTGSEDVVQWKWDATEAYEEKVFQYVVPAEHALIGTKTFKLIRIANAYLKSLTVTNTALPTYDLTVSVNNGEYGSVSPASVTDIPSGTTTSSSDNTFTVNGTTVTATPTTATAEYTYAFSSWSGLPATVTENATVTANFTRTPVSYTLGWNTNGGSELAGTPTTGTTAFGTTLTKPTDPTKSNYTFAGWNTANDGSGTNYTGAMTMPAAATTYYAKWTQTVTLDANTANHGSGANQSATAVWNATGLTGFTATEAETNYVVIGYYTAATGGTKVLNADGSFAADDVEGFITDRTWSRTGAAPTLYAQLVESLSVTYNGNGADSGDAPEDDHTYTSESNIMIKDNTGDLVKDGYIFTGWNTAAAGTGVYYPVGATIKINSNITLYAVWDEETCETLAEGTQNAAHTEITATTGTIATTGTEAQDNYIKISGGLPNGFTVTAKEGKAPIAAGDKLTVTVYNKNKSATDFGFILKTTSHTGSIASQSEGDIVYTLVAGDIEENGTIVIGRNSSNDRYHAVKLERCTRTNKTVTFNLHGHGEDIEAYVGVPSGSKIVAPIAPSAVGYDFDGWWEDADCETTQFDFSTGTITADKTLYAKWTPIDYIVTYSAPANSNNYTISVAGGVAGSANQTAHYGEEITLTATPASAAYIFSSWTIKKTGDGTDITNAVSLSGQTATATFTMPAYGVTVTATFADAYTLTYDANGVTADMPAVEYHGAGSISLSATVPTADDCVFLGWNTAADGSDNSHTFIAAGGAFTMPAAAEELYAQWGPKIASPVAAEAFTLATGRVATLSVKASTCSGALSYQWYKGEDEIAGATSTQYTIADDEIAEGDSYAYTCRVSTDTYHYTTSPAITVKGVSECGWEELALITATGGNAATATKGGETIEDSSASALISNLSTDGSAWKLGGGNNASWFGVHLESGFQVGDSVIMKIKTNDIYVADGASAAVDANAANVKVALSANQSRVRVYESDSLTMNTDNLYLRIAVTQAMIDAGLTKDLMFYRTQKATNPGLYQNLSVYTMQVKRYNCPGTNEPKAAGNWNDPAVWSTGVVPTINDRVYIDKEITVNVRNAQAKEILIGTGGQLVVNAAQGIMVDGNITKADGSQTSVGDVVLRSTKALGTGALIMNPANVTVAPKATVEQATKTGKIGTDWINQHVGTPFSDGNSYNNWYGSYVYYYDAADGSWVNVKRNTPEASLVPFRGYNVLRSDATTFWMQGTVNQPITDDVELSAVKNVGETTTENMFANSWLAPIDITAFADTDFVNIDKVIYIFNAGTPAQYADLIAAGTTSVNDGTAAAQWMALPIDAVKDDPSSFTYTVIPSMQGFKVLANAAEAKLKLNYDKLVYQPAKSSGADIQPNLAPEMRHSTDDKPEVLALNVRGESGYGDRVLLFVRDDFSTGYDDGWEGSKMTGMSIAPQMYAVSDDGNMSIDAVPEAEGTVIGFRAGQDNNYTFTFRYEGNDVLYLNDMLTETSTRIHEGFSYDFTTADGDIETRFVISHTPFVKTTPTGMDNVQGDEGQSVRKLFYQGVMYIIRGGRIYNAEGARIQ